MCHVLSLPGDSIGIFDMIVVTPEHADLGDSTEWALSRSGPSSRHESWLQSQKNRIAVERLGVPRLHNPARQLLPVLLDHFHGDGRIDPDFRHEQPDQQLSGLLM